MTKEMLIYDSNCSFCADIAKKLQKNYGIEIIGNDSKDLPAFIDKNQIKKDVHYIRRHGNFTVTYTGIEAAVQIIHRKHPTIVAIYYLPVIKQLTGLLYFILKKSRRYL